MTGTNPKVFFIDNFDSFTFNLVDEFRRRGCEVHVWRNNIDAREALRLALDLPPPAMIALSPGPGNPSQAGCCVELARLAAGKLPVFGVCLGHQAIIEALGGEVGFAGEVVHGKPAAVIHDGKGVFYGISSPMIAGRYHSLSARRLPPRIRVTAQTGDIVMAVEHDNYPIIGFQFHPESLLTPMGGLLIEAVIAWAVSRDKRGTVDA